ncbi:hypothetical protein [Tateyamaria sp. ANG-S1]|uniref:CBU_0592 family membrane protein n=1 Tax=Tateyamaria sp. ANG-S1 TaxID=1577905 RepID=UPI0005802AD2|nr:hypothetical protein [Tateyamaria sp. ANG-S1]KIC51236.1 hypothetical protein RA29_05205 [Tateyamaria sp. ANG-S1]
MTFLLLPSLAIYEVVDILGFALYVTNYSLLTTRCLSSDCLAYFTINLVAASCVLMGLMASFNLAAAMLQVFWVAMSIVGILVRLRGRRSRQTV